MAEKKQLKLRAGEQLCYQEQLRKLTNSKGNAIASPLFRTFSIVKDVARSVTSLVHIDGSGHTKRVELNLACKVEMASASNSSGGPVFVLRSPRVTDHLYEAENEVVYEEWFSQLRSLMEPKERLVLLNVLPSNQFPFTGPALLVVREGCVMLRKPSSLALLHSFPVVTITSFGADCFTVWISLCSACAKTRGSTTLLRFHPPNATARWDFFDELKRHGEMMTSGLWKYSESSSDEENFMLDHAAVCLADNVWDIQFEASFRNEVVAPLFTHCWKELAAELGYSMADMAIIERHANPAAHLLEEWTKSNPARDTQPKELIKAARRGNLEYEANKLLRLILDESSTIEDVRFPVGRAQPYASVACTPKQNPSTVLPLRPIHSTESGGHACKMSPSSSPKLPPRTLSQSDSPLPHQHQPDKPKERQGSQKAAPQNPLSDKNLYRIAHSVCSKHSNDWKRLAYELNLPTPSVLAIARAEDNVTDRIFQCLRQWKTSPQVVYARQLVEALQNTEMTDVASEFEAILAKYPVYYSSVSVVSPEMEEPFSLARQSSLPPSLGLQIDDETRYEVSLQDEPNTGYVQFSPARGNSFD